MERFSISDCIRECSGRDTMVLMLTKMLPAMPLLRMILEPVVIGVSLGQRNVHLLDVLTTPLHCNDVQ